MIDLGAFNGNSSSGKKNSKPENKVNVNSRNAKSNFVKSLTSNIFHNDVKILN